MGAVGSNAANGNVSSGSMILGGPQGASGVNLRGGMGMVFCYKNCFDQMGHKNCSSDREKLLKFESEGREFANFLMLF